MPTFVQVVTAAVSDLVEHGFDSEDRIRRWSDAIREAARQSMLSRGALERQLTDSLRGIYQRLVDHGQITRQHPGVPRFTIDQLRPQLRAELDRRVLASAGLIRMNREKSISQTLQRFSGWATSIPRGGSESVDKAAVKTDIRKALTQLPFEERRVIIDQGHKLASSISETMARGGGAIAAMWHSRWRQAGYNYRQDHKDRDEKVYAIRGSWALENGLMKAGRAGYYDDITKPAEEVFCRCYVTFFYALRGLPDEMITAKGRRELGRIKEMMEP